MITHTIDQFIMDPKSKQDKSKLQIWRICKNLKFLNFENKLHVTHFMKLLDNMCKYKMDQGSIVKDTEWTQFCSQTDRQMDKVKPIYPLQLRWARGITRSQWINCPRISQHRYYRVYTNGWHSTAKEIMMAPDDHGCDYYPSTHSSLL